MESQSLPGQNTARAIGRSRYMKQIYEFGDFRADPAEQLLAQNGQPVLLPPKVFETLLILLESDGRLIDKDEFMGKLWPDVFVEDGTLTQNISSLRKILGDGKNGTQIIQTVPKRGYRFAVPVRKIDETVVESANEVLLTQSRAAKKNWKKMVGLAVGIGAVLVLGAVGFQYLQVRRPANIRTIAVLPFFNENKDSSIDYLTQGLTTVVHAKLSEIPNLHVISEGSSDWFGLGDTDAVTAGRKLKVQAVLAARISRRKDGIAINAEMVKVADGSRIWGQQYTYPSADLSRIQAELAGSIADKLRLALTKEERARIARRPTEDPEAYQLYLQGQYYANQSMAGGLRRSIDSFQQATEKDPSFALAYVGLANDYNASNFIGIASARESYPKAKAAATRAILLDPLLAEAHTALATVKSRYEFDWDGARSESEKALQLDPNSVDTLDFYATGYLTPMRRHREAVEAMKRAVQLEPLSVSVNFGLGLTYHLAGELDKAEQQYRHVMEMAPNFPFPHLFFSNVLNAEGRYEESIGELEKGLIMAGESPHEAARQADALSAAFKSRGGKGYWRKYVDLGLEAMDQPAHFWFGDVTFIAQGYAGAGETDEAIKWLSKGYESREGCLLTGLNTVPAFNKLHGDPRFSALLQHMGLPE